MSMRSVRYTNVLGNQETFDSHYLIYEDRHTHREAKSQKSQLESSHNHGTRKNYKIPIKNKLT